MSQMKLCALGLGSNLGNRAKHIHDALKLITARVPNTSVINTAHLYESEPMYETNQPAFLNSACMLETTLRPMQLLQQLKHIEADLGRNKSHTRYGPRTIDLDILLYDNLVMNHIDTPSTQFSGTSTGLDLEIPHPRLPERGFVLQPLADIAPNIVHPVLGLTIASLCEKLGDEQLPRVIPLPNGQLVPWGKRTLLMGVLNVTPDSFSDGNSFLKPADAVSHAQSMVSSGADIIDIGGQSTRPGAVRVSAEEELSRIAPIVQQIRSDGMCVPISVDTFYSSVAHELLQTGSVDIINDVSGGKFDEKMYSVVSKHCCPMVIMHSRGNAQNMQALAKYGDDVVQDVVDELEICVKGAMQAGVPRWSLISDPGFGFAKALEDNVTLLRHLDRFSSGPEGLGFPLLLGCSRKSFLGRLGGGAFDGRGGEGDLVVGDRDFATAACCALSVPWVDILRVHNVRGMRNAVGVADALRR